MKKVLFVFYLMAFIFSYFLPVNVFATNSNESIQVLLNDRKIKFDVEPIILSGRTLFNKLQGVGDYRGFL